ncbi:DUF2199 domain-containing protein [Celeribacter indicus]|uniref:Uncharacterized protein n=1 Tax=Celeribacter indicus TaxID=1208324 RepID=A0A0B5DXE8_9RHOB|nr:DUF2199 domain-containing protein [Celeribacter indicus]AJE48123.1 hypothetical protein P73_3408 [Celeribacter indicus]SDW33155.1 hypothetical protein SAMN05443573_102407 [Celeribacter indicus]
MASPLDLDPRWRALTERGGVIDLGFDHPSDWPHAPREEAPFVKAGADQLASELCRTGDRRFLRASLSLPIRGAEDALGVALWAEVPQAVFYAYVDLLDGGPVPEDSLATLANDLTPVAMAGAPVHLAFGDGSERPAATLEGIAEISFDALLDLYEASGTLGRSALKPS